MGGACYARSMGTKAHVDGQQQFGRAIRNDWPLDFSVSFLNHGSFGSVPHSVHAEAEEWRSRFEARPIEWFLRRSGTHLREAATVVAEFIGSDPEHTGFVVNATAAVNAILRDFPLNQGDEVLVLNHGYNAVKQAARHAAEAAGAHVVEVPIPLPLRGGPREVVDLVAASLTEKTRIAIIDQITSPTALVLPVKEIVELCRLHDIPVLVDGAHAPGMLEKPASSHQGAWWTGNLHKWVCAPKGCAVLARNADDCASVHAPVISHGYGETLAAEFDWQGTRDLAPWLTAPAAIAFWDRYGGIQAVRARNHQLVCEAHHMLLDRFDVEPISPSDGSMLGSMATIQLPEFAKSLSGVDTAEDFNAMLAERFSVEVPVLELDGQWYVRISAQVYNELEDYTRLADAIEVLSKETS